MATNKKAKSSEKEMEKKKICYCGSCDDPNPGLPGYITISLGLLMLPVTYGLWPEFDWVAKGWPIAIVMIGFVMLAKTTVCAFKSR